MKKLTIETKKDTAEKLGVVKLKGSAFFIQAKEFNAMVQAINTMANEINTLSEATVNNDFSAQIAAIHQKYAGNETGDLSTLKTKVKIHLIGAINELKKQLDDFNQIDDKLSEGADKTYSVNKILDSIQKSSETLVDGADAKNDTLRKVAENLKQFSQTVAQQITNLTDIIPAETESIHKLGAEFKLPYQTEIEGKVYDTFRLKKEVKIIKADDENEIIPVDLGIGSIIPISTSFSQERKNEILASFFANFTPGNLEFNMNVSTSSRLQPLNYLDKVTFDVEIPGIPEPFSLEFDFSKISYLQVQLPLGDLVLSDSSLIKIQNIQVFEKGNETPNQLNGIITHPNSFISIPIYSQNLGFSEGLGSINAWDNYFYITKNGIVNTTQGGSIGTDTSIIIDLEYVKTT